MTKAWAPGWWEVSGGAAQAGESSWEAVRREVREETGLDVSKADGGYLFTYRRINPDEGDNYFVDVYQTATVLLRWTKSKGTPQKVNSCITTASARHLNCNRKIR